MQAEEYGSERTLTRYERLALEDVAGHSGEWIDSLAEDAMQDGPAAQVLRDVRDITLGAVALLPVAADARGGLHKVIGEPDVTALRTAWAIIRAQADALAPGFAHGYLRQLADDVRGVLVEITEPAAP